MRPSLTGELRMIDAVSLRPLGAAALPHRRIRLVESLRGARVVARLPGEGRSEVCGHHQRAQRLKPGSPDYQSAALPFAKHCVLFLRRKLGERPQPPAKEKSR